MGRMKAISGLGKAVPLLVAEKWKVEGFVFGIKERMRAQV